MSPVDQSRNHVGRAATVALVGVLVLGLAVWLAAVALTPNTGTGSGKTVIGSATFGGGKTSRLAQEIEDRGPIFYGDVSGRKDRDIILQHIGDDPDEGWYAFRAQPANKDRECTWEWQADEEQFRAKCDRSLTAPADGEGLVRYPVEVEDGKLDVDLNYADRPSTTTTTAPESGDVPPTTAGG